MSDVLRYVGATVKRENDVLIIDSRNAAGIELPEYLSRKMRASTW